MRGHRDNRHVRAFSMEMANGLINVPQSGLYSSFRVTWS
jgi:hypothetical protein